MDESWRVTIGPSRPIISTSRQTSSPPHEGGLKPDDFRDVFGGPPLTVLRRHQNGGNPYGRSSTSCCFLSPSCDSSPLLRQPLQSLGLRPTSTQPPPASVTTFRRIAQSSELPQRRRNKDGSFYEDIFDAGSATGELAASKSRSFWTTRSRKPNSTSSSAAASAGASMGWTSDGAREEQAHISSLVPSSYYCSSCSPSSSNSLPLRYNSSSRFTTATTSTASAPETDPLLSSFASKLKPIIIPSRQRFSHSQRPDVLPSAAAAAAAASVEEEEEEYTDEEEGFGGIPKSEEFGSGKFYNIGDPFLCSFCVDLQQRKQYSPSNDSWRSSPKTISFCYDSSALQLWKMPGAERHLEEEEEEPHHGDDDEVDGCDAAVMCRPTYLGVGNRMSSAQERSFQDLEREEVIDFDEEELLQGEHEEEEEEEDDGDERSSTYTIEIKRESFVSPKQSTVRRNAAAESSVDEAIAWARENYFRIHHPKNIDNESNKEEEEEEMQDCRITN